MQMEAFQEVKQEITQMQALRYFDTSKDMVLHCIERIRFSHITRWKTS